MTQIHRVVLSIETKENGEVLRTSESPMYLGEGCTAEQLAEVLHKTVMSKFPLHFPEGVL